MKYQPKVGDVLNFSWSGFEELLNESEEATED